jgi:hypothetical protein
MCECPCRLTGLRAEHSSRGRSGPQHKLRGRLLCRSWYGGCDQRARGRTEQCAGSSFASIGDALVTSGGVSGATASFCAGIGATPHGRARRRGTCSWMRQRSASWQSISVSRTPKSWSRRGNHGARAARSGPSAFCLFRCRYGRWAHPGLRTRPRSARCPGAPATRHQARARRHRSRPGPAR